MKLFWLGKVIIDLNFFWYSLLLNFYLTGKIFCAVGDRCKPNADVTEGTCKSVMDCEIAIRLVNEWYLNDYYINNIVFFLNGYKSQQHK